MTKLTIYQQGWRDAYSGFDHNYYRVRGHVHSDQMSAWLSGYYAYRAGFHDEELNSYTLKVETH